MKKYTLTVTQLNKDPVEIPIPQEIFDLIAGGEPSDAENDTVEILITEYTDGKESAAVMILGDYA
jgi:hypothetical protein